MTVSRRNRSKRNNRNNRNTRNTRRYRRNRSRKRNFSSKRKSFKKLKGGDSKIPYTNLDELYKQINSRLENIGGLPFGVEEFKDKSLKLKDKIENVITKDGVDMLKERVNTLKENFLKSFLEKKTEFNDFKKNFEGNENNENLKKNVSEITELIEDFSDGLNKIFVEQTGGSAEELRDIEPGEGLDDQRELNCKICFGEITDQAPGFIIRHPQVFGLNSEHPNFPVHQDCLLEWLHRDPRCPLCRTRMIVPGHNLNNPLLNNVVAAGEMLGDIIARFRGPLLRIMIPLGALWILFGPTILLYNEGPLAEPLPIGIHLIMSYINIIFLILESLGSILEWLNSIHPALVMIAVMIWWRIILAATRR